MPRIRDQTKWDDLRTRAHALRLWGVDSSWDELRDQAWVPQLLDLEETERRRRSFELRLSAANLGKYESIDEFDWKHPRRSIADSSSNSSR